jgi:hypothetical protein
MAIATAAGAATAPTLSTTTTNYVFTPSGNDSFGSGASGTLVVSGASGLADDGGNASLTTTAPGVTFSSVTESGTSIDADYVSTASTTPGSYSLTLTDDNGTSAAAAGVVNVNAAPTVTGVSPAGTTGGNAPQVVVITGTGFVTGATVTFTNTTNGTTLASEASGGAFVNGKSGAVVTDTSGTTTTASTTLTVTTTPSTNVNGFVISGTGIATGTTVVSGGGSTTLTLSAAASVTSGTALTFTSASTQGASTFGSATSLGVEVSPTNSVTGAPDAGTYTATVTNPDGGSATGGTYTVSAFGVTDVTPSAAPVPSSGSNPVVVTILGAGFQTGAGVTLSGSGTGVTVSTTTLPLVTSATSITATFNVAAAATGVFNITVTNPSAGNGGNGAAYTLAGGFGAGNASNVAPVISATSETTPIVPGSAASVLTLTGTGFSQYTTAVAKVGTTTTTDSHVTLTNSGSDVGTSATFNLTVASGATAGPDSVVATNGSGSSTFPAALSVAGPAITSQTPTGIAVAAPYGTVISLNGTGFTNTTTGAITLHGGALAGTFSYVSPTVMDLVITTPPNATDATAGDAPTVTLTQTLASAVTVSSPVFTLKIDAAPTIGGVVTYKTGADVGVGATAQTVYFNGSGFQTGATVTKFVNGSAVADPDVTATVTNVTATQITATIAIAAGDTNFADGYTITNPDGGAVSTIATTDPLLIGAGPTITTVTPTTGDAGATTSFALAGTGYAAGAVVSLSPANGTCGTPTISASTTLSVSCTLGTAGVTPTYIVVTNPDGGSATSTTAVLPAEKAAVAAFHVAAVHGAAVAGKTVTITISGTGFYGQPKVTATGYKFGVTGDSGKLLTVRVTTKAGLSGEHLLTVKLANGKAGKAGFDTKK